MPVRIYDISKKLGLENKEVLAKAKELGITAARVASSTVDKITAEYLEEQLILLHPRPVAPPPPPPEPLAPPKTEPPAPEVAVPPPIAASTVVEPLHIITEPPAATPLVVAPPVVAAQAAALETPKPAAEPAPSVPQVGEAAVIAPAPARSTGRGHPACAG